MLYIFFYDLYSYNPINQTEVAQTEKVPLDYQDILYAPNIIYKKHGYSYTYDIFCARSMAFTFYRLQAKLIHEGGIQYTLG